MPLRLALRDLVKATLPQGGGQMGLMGLSPVGDGYHLLVPVDLDRARALSAAAAAGREGDVAALGGRPGWLYLPCRTYQVPAPTARGGAGRQAILEARRARALLTAAEIAGWARRRGWWVELSAD